MQGDRPSLTAVAVSFARALATIDRGAPGEGLDPSARALLPAAVRVAFDALASASRVSSLPLRAVRALSLGLVDHLELRTLAIDDVAHDAFARGASQLVILGAGLDARAWRLREMDRVRAFEVDHPSTQRYKRRHADEAERVRFVPVDFERDSLGDRLADAGHDARAATLWIWEGVTMYLAPEAMTSTLRVVRQRSAPGSTLALTYVTPDLATLPASLHGAVRAAFSLLGEPIRGALTVARLEALLASEGFAPASDTGVDDWVARFGGGRASLIRIAERLAVARVA